MTMNSCDYCSKKTSGLIICKSKMRRLIGICKSCQNKIGKIAEDLYNSGVY